MKHRHGKTLVEIGQEKNIYHLTVGVRYRCGLRELYIQEFYATYNTK